jgi:hypothetical protein
MPISPSDLKAEDFAKYPPEARQLAASYVSLLKDMPLAFLPLLLREIIEYDWKFPIERRDLNRQLSYLESLSAGQRRAMLAGFAELKLPASLEQMDWVGAPMRFSEQLTAYLWASHQIDSFRAAAVAYVQKLNAAMPNEALPMPRLGIVLIGQGVAENKYPLFRKLRPHGVYFKQVDPRDGLQAVLDVMARRARAHPAPFAHWYIDGGAAVSLPDSAAQQNRPAAAIAGVSYQSLAPVRSALLNHIQKIARSNSPGPEALVAALAQMQPAELGMNGDPVLNHFQVDLLTQGSGTQVFSTSFVQWAAREALRRAQPVTLFARFAPRQRERPLNELLAGTYPNELDPHGALIDADMGGYYTWLNQLRLSAGEKSSFLIWFEDHNEALAIGPAFSGGLESSERVSLAQIFSRIA